MGWFNKKEIKSREAPRLPELPEIPGLSESGFERNTKIPNLPSFPNNSLGDKFSQDTIKEAVSGGKEDDEFEEFADDFAEEDMQEMQAPPRTKIKRLTQEVSDSLPMPEKSMVKEKEPIFIRIDKFEESLENFEKIKEEMSEVEKMLKSTKEIKEQEQAELESWENQLQAIKDQIEKIDQKIFSKL